MNILVVETHAATRRMFDRLLEPLQHTTTHCEDAASAWSAWKRGDFPIVIIDQVLPDKDGLELCREIRAHSALKPPVILIIAGGYPEYYLEMLEAGADDILVQPLDAKTVRLRLKIAEKRAKELLSARLKEELMEVLTKALETMQLGVTITDAEGTILYCNWADAKMHGYKVEELIGKSARLYSPSSHWRWMTPAEMSDIHSWKRESINVRSDGSLFPVQLLSDVVTNAEGKAVALVTTCEDITDRKQIEDLLDKRKQEEEQLRYDAFHDGLTGLPNRSHFVQELSRRMEDQNSGSALHALLFLDLDRFKVVNDNLGHLSGDQLLEQVALRLTQCVRPNDLLARVGGDEFTILLSDLRSEDDAICVAQRIHDAFTIPYDLENGLLCCTVSIGIGFVTQRHEKPEDLLRDADQALYRAKAQGRSRTEIFQMDTDAIPPEIMNQNPTA